MKKPVLGFIGFGAMASILVESVINSGFVAPSSVVFTRKDAEKAHKTGASLGISYKTLEEVIALSDYIFLAVKPQQFLDIAPYLRGFAKHSVVISIMAGLDLATLHDVMGEVPIARVMPNTPSLVGAGATAITFDSGFHPPQKAFVLSFFQTIGEVVQIPENAHPSATAISGCGPAFFYTLAEAICQEGVEHGLTYDQALSLCAQTMIGAGHMLVESGKTTAALIREVASPNGSTEAGLNQLKAHRMEELFKDVIAAARKRAIELGYKKEK